MKFFNQYSALLGNQELLKKRVQNWKRLHIHMNISISNQISFCRILQTLVNWITESQWNYTIYKHRISTIISQNFHNHVYWPITIWLTFHIDSLSLGKKISKLFVKTCTFCMRRCLFIVMVVLSFCRSFLPTWKWVRLIWTE